MKKYFFILFFLTGVLTSFSQVSNPQSNNIDIQKYDFHLIINNKNDSIQGTADIQLHFLKDLAEFSFDLATKGSSGKGMQVKKVFINGKEWKDYKHKNNRINILYPGKKNKDLSVRIVYSGIPSDGLVISKNKYGKKSFFGDNWPNRAHFWLPVIDHPSDKALVSFEVIAPENMEVIASGKLVSRIKKNGHIKWFYKTEVPLATKVMVIGATSFNRKNYGIYHNIPVSGWIYENAPVKGLDDYAVSLEILKFYDSLIGPYSYSKLANVQSKTRFGGMENAGNIFYYENSVDGKAGVENLVAHEIAHQWFGNSVTEKNWRDIWLSEGFATYLTDVYLEHKYGKERLKDRMKMEREKVIRFNSNTTKPIVYKEDNLMKLLNPNSYEKGAWVLHMLRNKIGDEAFFKLLKEYYLKYKNKNASTEDFINIAEKISGKELEGFFNQWLKKPGIPQIKMDKNIENKKLILHIHQTNDVFKFDLPLLIKSDKGDKKINLSIDKKENIFKIPLKSTQNIKLILDPEVQVLFNLT